MENFKDSIYVENSSYGNKSSENNYCIVMPKEILNELWDNIRSEFVLYLSIHEIYDRFCNIINNWLNLYEINRLKGYLGYDVEVYFDKSYQIRFLNNFKFTEKKDIKKLMQKKNEIIYEENIDRKLYIVIPIKIWKELYDKLEKEILFEEINFKTKQKIKKIVNNWENLYNINKFKNYLGYNVILKESRFEVQFNNNIKIIENEIKEKPMQKKNTTINEIMTNNDFTKLSNNDIKNLIKKITKEGYKNGNFGEDLNTISKELNILTNSFRELNKIKTANVNEAKAVLLAKIVELKEKKQSIFESLF